MSKNKSGITFQRPESRKFGLLMDDAKRQTLITEWVKDDHNKLLMLSKHFGIQDGPSMFYELALALARELYPEPKKRGRKSKWTWAVKQRLVEEIERLVDPNDPTHGVAWACQQLAKRDPWTVFLETKDSLETDPDPAEALRHIYYEFRDVSRTTFKYDERNRAIDEQSPEVDGLVRNSKPK